MKRASGNNIGILAFQGSVEEHEYALEELDANPYLVRSVADLNEVDALIIPGGESTTLGVLLKDNPLLEKIKKRVIEGMPVYGTCMGLILLAKEVTKGSLKNQPIFGLLDVKIERNAYGRQRESFETIISIPRVSAPQYNAVFIRAPRITYTGPGVDVLGSYDNAPVLVQEGNILASSFHPELTDDLRIHKYFLQMIKKSKGSKAKILTTVSA